MTTHRPIDEIKAEERVNGDQIRALYKRQDELKREREAAEVAAVSHPWLGKRVTAPRRRSWGKPPVAFEGTLVVYGKLAHGRIRGFHGAVGTLIVLSDSGKTAHYFHVFSGEPAWSLVEPATDKRIKP